MCLLEHTVYIIFCTGKTRCHFAKLLFPIKGQTFYGYINKKVKAKPAIRSPGGQSTNHGYWYILISFYHKKSASVNSVCLFLCGLRLTIIVQ